MAKYSSPLANSNARFFTLNYAVKLSGVSEQEIVRAGEAQEFGYNVRTRLIDPHTFMEWLEKRSSLEIDDVSRMFSQIIFKLGDLQRGLAEVKRVLEKPDVDSGVA